MTVELMYQLPNAKSEKLNKFVVINNECQVLQIILEQDKTYIAPIDERNLINDLPDNTIEGKQ